MISGRALTVIPSGLADHRDFHVQLEKHADKGHRDDDRADGNILYGSVYGTVEISSPALRSGEGRYGRKVDWEIHGNSGRAS